MRSNLRRLFTSVLAPGVGGGDYLMDFAALADGALPAGWVGSTFAIASGIAINNPGLGSELFDAGAAAFTSGTYSWVAQGTNTLANVGNELEVTYVNSSNGANLVLRDSTDLSADLVGGGWYLYAFQGRRVGTGTSTYWLDKGEIQQLNVANATQELYQYRFCAFPNAATNTMRLAGLAAARKNYIAAQSIKRINAADLFAVAPFALSGNMAVRAALRLPYGSNDRRAEPSGIVGWLDDEANPQNYIMAHVDRTSNLGAHIYKVVGGVVTIIGRDSVTYAQDAVLEIRRTGTTTFQLWYNGVQVGTDRTISDAGILSNTKCGLLNPGGQASGCTRFSVVRL